MDRDGRMRKRSLRRWRERALTLNLKAHDLVEQMDAQGIEEAEEVRVAAGDLVTASWELRTAFDRRLSEDGPHD